MRKILAYILYFIIGGYIVFNRGISGLSIGPLYLGEIGLFLGLPFLLKALLIQSKTFFWMNILILIYFIWGLLHLSFGTINLYSLQQFVLVYYIAFIPIGYGVGKRYPDIFDRIFPFFLKTHVIFAIFRPIFIIFLTGSIMIGETSLFGIYGTYVLFTVPALFYFTLIKKNNFWALLSLLAILSLASRNGFISLIACGLISIKMIGFKEIKGFFKLILITLIITGLFGATVTNIPGLNIRGDLSLTNLFDILESIVVESEDSNLNGSRSHRLEMWEKILNKRIDSGLFFGEGFGTNMTDTVFVHPHNSLVSIFGRLGLVGLLIWLLLYIKILIQNINIFKRILNKKRTLWFILFIISSLITACFSVVLESPMLAIPIYFIYGLSLSEYSKIR